MIYLFEDRLNRMGQYYGSEVPPEGIVLAKMEYDEGSGESLESYLGREFADAEGALFHKSYSGDSEGILPGKIKDYFVSQGKIFVFFSGGIESVNYTGNTASVNSRVFYRNLKAFAESEPKEVRVLCFGSKFELCENLNFRRAIYMAVSNIETVDDGLIDKKTIKEVMGVLRIYGDKNGKIADVAGKLMAWIESRYDLEKPVLDSTGKTGIGFSVLKGQIDKAILSLAAATGGIQ